MIRTAPRPSVQDTGQIASDGVAVLVTAAVLLLLFMSKPDSWRDSSWAGAANQSSMEIALQTATADAPPSPPAPPKPLLHREMPRQIPVARVPAPAPQEPARAESDPVPEGGALVAAPAAVPAPGYESRPDLEAEYGAGLRADIDRRTRPPDSTQYRLRRPSGEVRLSFVVTRAGGEAKAVRLLRSSGSSILDEQALGIVASGRYPSMSAKLFAGESEHVFVVTIEFRPAG